MPAAVATRISASSATTSVAASARTSTPIIGAGEVGGAEGGGFRYKVAVEGPEQEEGDVPLWYYYLIAGPEGDQLYAVFTLTRALETRFGDQDLRMVGSLEWKAPAGNDSR